MHTRPELSGAEALELCVQVRLKECLPIPYAVQLRDAQAVVRLQVRENGLDQSPGRIHGCGEQMAY